jgi:predicted Zn-dependent protease
VGSSGRPVLRAVAVAAVVVLLWSISTLLTGEYRSRKVARAARAAERGRVDLNERLPDAAVARLRDAVALDPGRIPYRLDLAQALLAIGQIGEATTYLHDVLREDPVNGDANLALARIYDAQGNVPEAETAFYRAIYGRWGPDAQDARVQARLELIAFLRRTADPDRVRAELLRLATAFPGDLALQVHAGRSLLEMGLPDEAAHVFETAGARFAEPGGAFAGLAEAEFRRGNYTAALAAARRALQVDPGDRDSAARRDLATTLLAMDPTQPRLSVRERTARIAALLARVRPLLDACQEAGPIDDGDGDLRGLVDAWLGRTRGRQVAEVDAGFRLLETAARELTGRCRQDGGDQVLDLMLQRIAGPPQT